MRLDQLDDTISSELDLMADSNDTHQLLFWHKQHVSTVSVLSFDQVRRSETV